MTELVTWKGQREGEILERQGKMALVLWQECYGQQARWKDPQNPGKAGYAIGHEIVEIPEHKSWIDTTDPAFIITRQQTIYDLAQNAIKSGLFPGEERTIWKKNGRKFVLRREASLSEIRLFFFRTATKWISTRIAVWATDRSGPNNKGYWKILEDEYHKFVAECKGE